VKVLQWSIAHGIHAHIPPICGLPFRATEKPIVSGCAPPRDGLFRRIEFSAPTHPLRYCNPRQLRHAEDPH